MQRIHSPITTLGLLVAMAIMLRPDATLAQAGVEFQGRRLTVYPRSEVGVDEDGKPWFEDSRRVHEGLEWQKSPEEYRDALRQTGMEDHLRRASMAPLLGRDAWSLVGPIGTFGAAPRNGRIAGIQLIDTGTGPAVFVGSCQGGLWMTQNSDIDGGVWDDIGRTLPNPSVRGFAVHPTNLDHIIVGTGDDSRYVGSGMYVTHDRGNSWDLVSVPLNASAYFRILYQNRPSTPAHQYLIAAGSYGLMRSIDGGVTWLIASYNDGLPTDEGIWSDLVEHPNQPNIMYACNGRRPDPSQNGVYSSVDFGETWYQLTSPVLPTVAWGRASMAICRTAPDVLVVLVEGGGMLAGVYRTENGGATWSDITGALKTESFSFGRDQIDHAQAVAIRPTNPDQIFLGTVNLAMSTDGGDTWQIGGDTGINWGHDDITQLYFSQVISENSMWICNDGGIYYHNFADGYTYSFIGGSTSGLACSEIDYMDADRDMRVFGMQDNGTLMSRDAGQTWIDGGAGDGADVEIYDPEAGHYFKNDGDYGQSDDWGAWQTFRMELGQEPEYLYNPFPVYHAALTSQPFHGVIASHDQQSIYTINAASGVTWQEQVSDLQADYYLIRSITASRASDFSYFTLYWDYNPGDLTIVRNVAGQGWVTHHTEDVAGNGQRISWVTPSRFWPGEAWIGLRGVDGQPKAMHTTDFGETWDDITGELSPVNDVICLEVEPFNPRVLYAGTDLGIFRSTNGGESWAPFQDGLPIGRCKILRFVIDSDQASEHQLVLAMDGRGLWTRPITAPPVVFVDLTNVGAQDGSFEHPYRTFAAGIQNAPDGAVVAVRAATYHEPYIYSSGVQVVAWGGGSLIVR